MLYLMDDAGSYGYYTYDSREETLQRFSGAVFTDDAGQSLRVPMLYVYIAGGAALVLLILLIVFASVAGSRGRKLRLLPDTGASQPAADEGTPEATTDATSAADAASDLEQLPVASPQEDPSLSADVPVSLPRSLRSRSRRLKPPPRKQRKPVLPPPSLRRMQPWRIPSAIFPWMSCCETSMTCDP